MDGVQEDIQAINRGIDGTNSFGRMRIFAGVILGIGSGRVFGHLEEWCGTINRFEAAVRMAGV